jgi:hypothetical protein
LDGDEEPPAVTKSGSRVLRAVVSAELPVAEVEFFAGTRSLGSSTEPPFEFDVSITSFESGVQVYSAVATDAAGQDGLDELEVSVNVVGGAIESLSEDIFPAGFTGEVDIAVGGGIQVDEERAYVAGFNESGTGALFAFDVALNEIWGREIGDSGIRAAPSILPSGDLALGISMNGDWEVQVISSVDGAVQAAWPLAYSPKPGERNDGWGPLTVVRDGKIEATSTPFSVSRYNNDGSGAVARYQATGAVADLATSFAGTSTFVSFGHVLEFSDTPCATGTRNCVASVRANGELEWMSGLTEIASGVHYLAPTRDGGVLIVGEVFEEADGSYHLLRFGPNGQNEREAWGGELPYDVAWEEGDRVADAAAHPSDGIIVCGTNGPIIQGAGEDENRSPEPYVAAYDGSLDKVWELRDFVDDLRGSSVLACAANSRHVFVYGVRDPVASGDGTPPVDGSAWIAKITL